MANPSVNAFLANLSDESWVHLDRASVIAGLTDYIDQERCRSTSWAASFAAHCPVPEVSVSEYLPRLLRDTPLGDLWVGIRFLGGNLAAPFVELLASEIPITSPCLLQQTRNVIRREFERFQPLWLRFPVRPQSPWLIATPLINSMIRLDMTTVIGSIAQLHKTPSPSQMDRLRIVPVHTVDFMDELKALYADFHRDHSELKVDVTPSSPEELKSCVEDGVVLRAMVGHRSAGFIAALPEAFWGIPGYCIYEEILGTDFRGRGLGPVLQRHLIEALPTSALLFGTIVGTNQASMKTALRLGRVRCIEQYFYDLRDEAT